MTMYRHALPQLSGKLFLTDGGIETELIFKAGLDLPLFASFPLVETDEGRAHLDAYLEPFIATARECRVGFVLGTPTWRANRDWGARLGYDEAALARVNRQAVELALATRARHAAPATPIVVEGMIGPRGDGYVPDAMMSADEAQAYHAAQVTTLRDAGADMVTVLTMNYVDEAIGVVRAAQAAGIPVAVGFTVETNGALPSGDSLADAIRRVDDATNSGAAYFLVNCAHPDHFSSVLAGDDAWVGRVRGIRANASRMSHAELDMASELDAGDPAEFGELYRVMRERLPNLTVLGGCCGTGHDHLAQVAEACIGA